MGVSRGRAALIEEDSFEPASLDEAWTDYRTKHPERNNPDGYAAFRAGFRRGVAQGALMCASTFVHGVDTEPRVDEPRDRPAGVEE